jgi:hypothetical protein
MIYNLKKDDTFVELENKWLDWEQYNGHFAHIDEVKIDENNRNLYMTLCSDETGYDCEILPFIYSWTGREFEECIDIDIESCDDILFLNEETQELQVIIDGLLIYTYGENPNCHIEGCSLLREALVK